MAGAQDLLTRRDAILRVTALLGGIPLVGGHALLTGCAAGGGRRPGTSARFTAQDIAFLGEVADTLLPETSTPGAKAAGVGPFMAAMVTDTYDDAEQRIFRAGMRALDDQCLAMHGTPFLAATGAERLALLERLDREQHTYTRSRRPGDAPHYFRLMKELALLGYFTSEIGYTQAMRYTETPRRFDPCIPYAPGDRIWAPHA